MTAEQICEVRRGLGVNQIEFASLLGAHQMTVSRWERGELSPSDYQAAMISEFAKAAQDEKIKKILSGIIIGAGIIAALFLLLKTARGEK